MDLQKKEHKRKLVLKALEERRQEQSKDKLLMDIIAAVPRSTDTHIDAVIKKVRRENENDALKLEAALAHCRNLSYNLTGAKPTQLWTESARMVWLDTIEAVTRQSSRWKACPLVMVHPYCGTVEVVISLCGKHQALSEYSRMRLFAEDLREGLDEILDEIHPIKDNESGQALPFEETKEILLDISNNDDRLSEEDEGHLSEEDTASVELDKEVEKVSKDWTLDEVKTDGEPTAKSRLISPVDRDMKSPPNVTVNLTSTPPPTMNQSRTSSTSTLSSFGSPLFDIESPKKPQKPSPKKPSPEKPPMSPISSAAAAAAATKVIPGHQMPMQLAQDILDRTSRSLADDLRAEVEAFALDWPSNSRDRSRHTSNRAGASVNRSLFSDNDRQVTYKPSPWQISAVPEEDADPQPLTPPPKKSTKAPSDLSNALEAYPDGFTMIPLKNRRKSDAKKQKDKKRPVSSPNLPANKQSRMDRTEDAIEQLQMGQANQNAVLKQLADQMSQFNLHWQLQNSKK